MKVQMLIELDYDAVQMHGNDKKAKDWFHNEVLGGEYGNLILHSNELGDEVGVVTVIKRTPAPAPE